VTEDLLVAEESLLDTMALTPAFGLVADPYLETVTPPEKTSPCRLRERVQRRPSPS